MLGNSSAIFNPVICNLLARINPESILELGCGEGKLGDLAKQSNLMPKLTAVQKLFSKSDLLHLNSKGYTNIIGSNILEYFKEGFDDVYDLIVAMDVIEHFLYSDAISIIDFALYKSKWLLLVWPSKPPQSGISNKFDRHRTSCELGTLTNLFDVAYYEQRGFAQVNYLHRYHLCVLLGHMNSANFS